jgi:LysM repeat protein
VELARGVRAGVAVVGEEDAARALAKAASVLRRCAAIVVDGKPVAGLATETDARAALERLKSYYAASVPDLEEEPKFKEAVAIRPMSLPVAHCYPTPQAAEVALRGGTLPAGSEHRVAAGENAWEIARHYQLSLSELQRLNPGNALHPLRAGRTLRVRPAPRPPITVVVKRHVRATENVAFATEKKPSAQLFRGKHLLLQPGRPGKVVLTTAILYENGVPTGRQLLARQILVPSRPKIVAVGTRG